MIAQTTFNGTPDDLKRMLTEVVTPLVDRIRELEVAAGSRKHAYSVAEVAEQIGFSSATVTLFIKKGRVGRNGKTYTLTAKEPLPGKYRVLPSDLDEFLSHF